MKRRLKHILSWFDGLMNGNPGFGNTSLRRIYRSHRSTLDETLTNGQKKTREKKKNIWNQSPFSHAYVEEFKKECSYKVYDNERTRRDRPTREKNLKFLSQSTWWFSSIVVAITWFFFFCFVLFCLSSPYHAPGEGKNFVCLALHLSLETIVPRLRCNEISHDIKLQFCSHIHFIGFSSSLFFFGVFFLFCIDGFIIYVGGIVRTRGSHSL